MGFRLWLWARSKCSTQLLFSDGCRHRVVALLSLVDSVIPVLGTVEAVVEYFEAIG